MLGHVLRLDIQTPAQQSMINYFQEDNRKKFAGRPRTTLPVVLNNDLKEAAELFEIEIAQLETLQDLRRAREVADNKYVWKGPTTLVCSIA